jgi:hypothetical protein
MAWKMEGKPPKRGKERILEEDARRDMKRPVEGWQHKGEEKQNEI